MNPERIRADFDEIAALAESGESGIDHYDGFILSHVPTPATEILDVGCGLGRLTAALATDSRQVLGIDLSPAMIERASASQTPGVAFLCADFLELDFGERRFDCIVSGATLHHMPQVAAVTRMAELLRPGGRLIIHDLRRNLTLADTARSLTALSLMALGRFVRTGRVRNRRALRDAWKRHGANETYLSLPEASALSERLLPGARVFTHWRWRYTIVWDKEPAAR